MSTDTPKPKLTASGYLARATRLMLLISALVFPAAAGATPMTIDRGASDAARADAALPAFSAFTNLQLPAGAQPRTSEQESGLNSVGCTGVGECVAAGFYTDTNERPSDYARGVYDTQVMIASETDGRWARATAISLPSDATTAAGAQDATLGAVTCTGDGNCVAVGDYADGNGTAPSPADPDGPAYDNQPMVLTETHGEWAPAVRLTLPPGDASARGAQDAELNSVACTSTGNCVAVGSYVSTGATETGDGNASIGAPGRNALLIVETDGRWGPAAAVALAGGQLATVIAHLAQNAPSPVEFLRSLTDALVAGLESSDFASGCPIATVALETATTCEPMRIAAEQQFGAWEIAIARGLARPHPPRQRHRDIAAQILMLLEGALIVARVRRAATPIHSLHATFERLLA